MGRSQRHMIAQQNTSARGEIYAEGVLAPAILRQLPGPPAPTVPVGPSGGALKGSSMSGAIPIGFIAPTPHSVGNPEELAPQLGAPASRQSPSTALPAERIYPMGPFSLARVEPVENPLGVWYILPVEDGENLREGDEVLIEATGSSATNGNHTVTQLLTGADTRFFVPDIEIASPIEAKGRLTINAGA